MAETNIDRLTSGIPFENMGRLQFKIVILCFLAILFDGIDTTAIGVVVPTLAKSWAVPPAAFTAAFLATNLGAVVGYIACGPISDRIGRRPLIIVSVIWFGVCTLLTVLVDSVTALWLLRFATALGLGGAVPTGIAQAADYAPVKYRDAMTVAVTTGLAAGAMLSGLLGASLIQNFGWQAVFVVGGVLPLLLAPALWMWLPEAPGFQRGPTAPSSAKVWSGFSRLFSNEFAARTLLLWGYSFLIFTTNYALISWIPTLLLSFDFTPGRAPIGVAALGIGGVIGNIILMFLAPKFGALHSRCGGTPCHRRHSRHRLGRSAKRSAACHARRYRRGTSRKLGRPSRARSLDLSKRPAHYRRGLLIGTRPVRIDRRARSRRAHAFDWLAGARNRAIGVPASVGGDRNLGVAAQARMSTRLDLAVTSPYRF
jgi:MFS family permease